MVRLWMLTVPVFLACSRAEPAGSDGGGGAGAGGDATGGGGTHSDSDPGAGGTEGGVTCASETAGPGDCCIHNLTSGAPGLKDAMLTGPVLATGAGLGSDACYMAPANEASAFWFEAQDANGDRWRFTLSLPGLTNPVTVGQVVQVDAHEMPSSFVTKGNAHVTLREADGKLLAAFAWAGELEYLRHPEEITVVKGQLACTESTYCGDVTGYDLSVTLGTTQRVLGYRETATLDGFSVTHGGFVVRGLGHCADWVPQYVALGMRRIP